MGNVKDITSLEAYQEYVKASQNLNKYNEERKQREKNIFDLFDQSKAKRMDSDMAETFREAEELENEADRLKKEAKEAQQALDKFMEESPHYANLKGDALRNLQKEGKEFISELFDKAESKVHEAVEVLQAINKSKNTFNNNAGDFIPSVSHTMQDLLTVKKDLNPNP